MKHFYTKALLILVSLFASWNVTKAQTYEQQVISFLKEIPEENIQNSSPTDLMNLLTDESKDWIENIECQNIDLIKGKAGIYANLSKESTDPAFIKVNFKSSKLMNAYRVVSYGNNIEQPTINVSILLNNNPYIQKSFGYVAKVDSSKDLTFLNKVLSNFDNNVYINGNPLNPLEPLSNIEILIEPRDMSIKIQLLGFRIYYSGTSDQSGIETGIKYIEKTQENNIIEYYDLMGRRLADAPQSGVYLRKCGSKVEKLVGNRR